MTVFISVMSIIHSICLFKVCLLLAFFSATKGRGVGKGAGVERAPEELLLAFRDVEQLS